MMMPKMTIALLACLAGGARAQDEESVTCKTAREGRIASLLLLDPRDCVGIGLTLLMTIADVVQGSAAMRARSASMTCSHSSQPTGRRVRPGLASTFRVARRFTSTAQQVHLATLA